MLLLEFIDQDYPLTLAIVLLKIILICPPARLHLEERIIDLVIYFDNSTPTQFKWMNNFLEILNVIFAFYGHNASLTKYNSSRFTSCLAETF